MFRWLGSFLVVPAIVLAACGRQLTGLDAPGAGSIPSGHMLIRFRVAGPLDFTNVRYLIVFNTSGDAVPPSEPLPQTSYKHYSFAIVVGGDQYTTSPYLLQYYLAPGTSSGLQGYRITIPPQFMNYVPDSGGNASGGGEFTVTFDRNLLYGVNLSGASPTPAAGATPATTATFVPNSGPTTMAQETWAINFITTDPSGFPIDSMGPLGATDTTFSLPVNTARSLDIPYTKPIGTSTVSNPSAQLQGYEIINAL